MTTTQYAVAESESSFIAAVQCLGGDDSVVRIRFESRNGFPVIAAAFDDAAYWVVLEGVALPIEGTDLGPTIKIWWRRRGDKTPCTLTDIHQVVELVNGRWSNYTAGGVSNTGIGGTRADGDLELIGNRGTQVGAIVFSSMMDLGTQRFYEQLQ